MQDPESIRRLIHRALEEDLGSGDVTTDALIESKGGLRAEIIARETLVLCGIDIADAVFNACDDRIKFRKVQSDGERIEPGRAVAELRGPARGILKGERVALNFLGLLSGIATLTRRYVDLTVPYKAKITDTRKTRPGLRILEKYAVRCGGGTNHRFGLYDGILIKDTHIRAVGGIKEAVKRARQRAHHLLKIEVETENLQQVKEALEAGAEVIMLDNMDIPTLHRAVEQIGGRALVEASGNISPDNIAQVASSGVDLISVGALTHSAPASDVSLKIRDILLNF